RLKQREASVGWPFTDAEFKDFLLSPETVQRRYALRNALMAWELLPLEAIASQALEYLPAAARLDAKLFPVIKPRPNSFVHGTSDDAMVFINVDPALQTRQIEALIVHELHHIGLFPFECVDDVRQELRAPVRRAVGLMRNFREGYAMLAAAGGPDVHPRHFDGAAARHEWDRAMAHFEADLKAIERFLFDVIHDRLTPEQAERLAAEFLGRQGPWYTVGWRMAATVEQYFGRALLIDSMPDPRLLLLCYNSAAVQAASDRAADRFPIWSLDLMRTLVPDRAGPAP
ncbi:MAG TPA: DUF5700 domain-containing putative Zn-dependent protease, partial [Rhizomicrobium sp.]